MEKIILEKLEEIKSLLTLLNPNKNFYTTKEAAEYIGVSHSYLFKLMSKGLISYTKPSGKIAYFSKESLDNYLSLNRIKTQDEIDTEADNYIIKSNLKNKR